MRFCCARIVRAVGRLESRTTEMSRKIQQRRNFEKDSSGTRGRTARVRERLFTISESEPLDAEVIGSFSSDRHWIRWKRRNFNI
jgi:hypothetical protein